MVNIKRLILALLISTVTFTFYGCWSYRGLNKLVIVSGIAVDKDYDKGIYKVTFEILNLVPSKEQTNMKAKYLESEGKTIFDAVRNARLKTAGRLYFGNTQIIIISQELAKREKISNYIDLFIRDLEFRETSNIIISMEQTAKEIFNAKPMDASVLSYQLEANIETDNKITSGSYNIEVYKIYNRTQSEGCELVVPAIRIVENDDERVTQFYGSAVFKDDKLIGFIDPEENKYLLMADDRIKGGIITLVDSKNGGENISLEIYMSHTSVDVSYINEKVKINMKIITSVFEGENIGTQKYSTTDQIKQLQNIAEVKIKNKIYTLISKAQNEFQSDIFCFGNTLYKTKPDQWKQVGGRWEKLFCDAEINIESKVIIINTAMVS